jgi:hypothetical protein
MPPGPNPAASRPLRVEQMGRAWVVVEGLGVVSMHKRWGEAKAALADALKRREAFNKRYQSPDAPPPPEEPPPGSIVEGGSGGAVGGAS